MPQVTSLERESLIPPQGPEMAKAVEQLEASHSLQSHEVVDAEGFTRPVYDIAGRSVMFRGRQEMPRLEGVSYDIPEGPGQEPLPVLYDPDDLPDRAGNEAKQAEFEGYIEASTNGVESVIVSANTPEGILATAAQLNPDHAADYGRMAEEMAAGSYGPDALKLLDAITASLLINSEGELGTHTGNRGRTIDIDAYALVTAALAGDTEAGEVVDRRVEQFKRLLAEQAVGTLSLRKAEYDSWVERQSQTPEKLRAENVALVHSTAHAIERNDQGEVVLKPGSQKRTDKFPRSTLHFTANSQVTGHYGGNWGAENRLIVGNLQKMIDANGRPDVMNEVDTFFAVNPGTELVIPDASVIEGSPDSVDLLTVDGALVVYKAASDAEYSEAERAEIVRLAGEFGIQRVAGEGYADMLREVTLRQTMKQKGVSPRQMARAGAHYSDNEGFNRSYVALRQEIGAMGGSLHTYTSESAIESMASRSMVHGTEIVLGEAYGHGNYLSLAALRQVTASGYWPARYAKASVEMTVNAPMM